MNYRDYISKWIEGIIDEIVFWDDFMATEGGEYYYDYFNTISPKRHFELEGDIPANMYGKTLKFIDVGSGPFSRCGRKTELVNLDAISADPLAQAYRFLKQKHRIDNGNRVETCFVELLGRKYRANTFDIVHMSNALDHCFSAIDGLYQLINICKVGGKVILRHHENEAENEHYQGLHQWNLSLHNHEQSFVIWRNDIRIDVCDVLADYVDFDLYPDQYEEYWIYNKVVMTKKKDINPPNENYYEELLDTIYDALIKRLIIEENSLHREHEEDEFIIRIKKIVNDLTHSQEVLNNKGIHSASVYGIGKYGKNLCYLLNELGVKIENKFDRNGKNTGCKEAVSLESFNGDITSDIIIVTVDDKSVFNQLKNIGYDNTISISGFLDLF